MNLTADNSLSNLKEYFAKFNMTQIYSSLFLFVFGLLGNILSLSILAYSKDKLPRIIGCKYLIILTISNTVYLLATFYTGTYLRLVYIFKLDHKWTFQYFDSNIFMCKSLPYLRYTTRLLSTMIKMCFSLERFLSIYYPVKMKTLNIRCSHFFNFAILISFLLPAYLPYFLEVQAKIGPYNIYKDFNFLSLRPYIGQFQCTVKNGLIGRLAKLNFGLNLIILFSYILVLLAIFAINLKLKRTNSFRFRMTSRTAQIVIANRSQHRNKQFINEQNGLTRTNSCLESIRKPRNKAKIMNKKKDDIRMLTSISLSFVIFNTPHFITVILTAFFLVNTANLEAIKTADFDRLLLIRTGLAISDIFQQANFSITVLIFFFNGKAFRYHGFRLFKKIFRL